jgi:hypothetical protein
MQGEVYLAVLIGRWGDEKALTREDDGTVREIPFAAYYEGEEARIPEVGNHLCFYLNDEGEIARCEFCDDVPPQQHRVYRDLDQLLADAAQRRADPGT